MSDTILSLDRLCVGYGERLAAADVSFSLQRGEILCLVGESGCGKSTLLKALMAAPEVRLFSGEITLEGTALSSLGPKQRRRLCSEKMGIVFQTPEAAFNPIRSYRKQFVETLKSHGKYDPGSFEAKAAEAFAKVELDDWRRVLSECPFALSGGMNQRAALALALLLEQEILLCDEPTSALDATIQLQVAEELRRLRQNSGVQAAAAEQRRDADHRDPQSGAGTFPGRPYRRHVHRTAGGVRQGLRRAVQGAAPLYQKPAGGDPEP